MRLTYRGVVCTQVQFLSAVAAVSGASEGDTFRLLESLLAAFQYPSGPNTLRLIADDVNRVTYGQCKMTLDGDAP